MKVTAATSNRTSPDSPIEATVFVDGVGTVDNGDSYTDPTTSLQVQKSVQGSSIAFVAPRWTLDVDHKIARVVKDGWHYLNMAITITSLLETPVTGVLGVTYNPETYAHILKRVEDEQRNAATSHAAVVDHSSSLTRSLLMSKSAKPHAVLLYDPADDETKFLQSATPNLPGRKLKQSYTWCCNGVEYDIMDQICCQGVIQTLPTTPSACCGSVAYPTIDNSLSCCNDGVVRPTPCDRDD
jgi:hypothetical protein